MKSPIQILKDAAANLQGLTVRNLGGTAARRETLLATPYSDGGLKGLLRREIVPSPKQPRTPAYRFFATDVGRKLLRDLESNPDAQPQIPRGRPHWQSQVAKHFATRRATKKRLAPKRKHENQAKYDARMANPQNHREEFDMVPEEGDLNMSTTSPEFRALPSLEKIRILRYQSGRSKPNPTGD